jgi:hypothetical protein
MTSRLCWLLIAVSLSVFGLGCLPELEDPPLTATGEAPAQWELTGSGTTAASGTVPMPTTCSGEFKGVLQDPAIDLSPPPCVVIGNVVVSSQPSAKLKALLSQVQSIQGTLEIHGDVALTTVLPKLTALIGLTVSGGGKGKVWAIPNQLKGLNSVSVLNTEFIRVEGGAGLLAMAQVAISQNLSLIAISALADTKTLGGVNISVNPMLVNLSIAPQVTELHTLDIHDNLQLKNVEPFNVLTQVSGSVIVDNCASLPHVYFLSELKSAQSLTLMRLNLSQIDLPKLKQVGNLSVSHVDQLASLKGLTTQVSQSVRMCVAKLTCTAWSAWLQQYAPGLSPLPCMGSAKCQP